MSVESWNSAAGAARAKSGPHAPSSGITICEVKGIPSHRRAHVEEAVIAGASGLSHEYEAWIVPARRPPAYSVRINGPRGFFREIRFSGHETTSEIEKHVRHAIDN
jgi:hypothetical protein